MYHRLTKVNSGAHLNEEVHTENSRHGMGVQHVEVLVVRLLIESEWDRDPSSRLGLGTVCELEGWQEAKFAQPVLPKITKERLCGHCAQDAETGTGVPECKQVFRSDRYLCHRHRRRTRRSRAEVGDGIE